MADGWMATSVGQLLVERPARGGRTGHYRGAVGRSQYFVWEMLYIGDSRAGGVGGYLGAERSWSRRYWGLSVVMDLAPRRMASFRVSGLPASASDAGKAMLESWQVDGLNPQWPLGLEIAGYTTYTPEQAVACKGPGDA